MVCSEADSRFVHFLLDQSLRHLKFVSRLTAAVVNTFSGIVSFYRGNCMYSMYIMQNMYVHNEVCM